MAIRARRRAGQPQRHRDTLGGFSEDEFGLGLQVVAAAGPAGPRRTASTEQAAEQVADVGPARLTGRVEQIVQVELDAVTGAEPAEVASVEAATTEPAAGEEPTGFVVLLALGRIREHAVRFGHRLETVRGGRIGVGVGVKVAGEFPVGLLDVVGAGVRGDAELLVEVLFDPFPLGHSASPPYPARYLAYSPCGDSDSAF